MALFRQIYILTWKTILIEFNRHFLSTLFRAFVLPVAYIIFLSYAQNLFIAHSNYGIADSSPVLTLADAMGGLDSNLKLLMVNNGFSGGDIDKVINSVTSPVNASGHQVVLLPQEAELAGLCSQHIQGYSDCYAAAIFHSSPTEGSGGSWNYTIRIPPSLGAKVDVQTTRNDVEVYGIPLQHAVDSAIASLTGGGSQKSLSQVSQYPYTSETEKQRQGGVHDRYQNAIRSALAVAFFIAQIGVVYHLVGFMALERERGISQLLEAMMPNKRRWQPQLARLLSYFFAFSIIYMPGWLVIAGVLKSLVYTYTSASTVIGFYLISGLSLTSSAIFGAAFFRRVQLSSITVSIVSLVLGIIGMVTASGGNAVVGFLSLFFPPINIINFADQMTYYELEHQTMNLYVGAPGSKSRLPGLLFWECLILQIVVFPILAAVAERYLYPSKSKHRKIICTSKTAEYPVRLNNLSKYYRHSWISRLFRRSPIRAVDDLSTAINSGQITVLLGPNGSGKTTTLGCIAGLEAPVNGTIEIESAGGLGICPQKNVFWDLLTVEEHVKILNKLKSVGRTSSNEDVQGLIRACDLEVKRDAPAKTLSGGQKRKLQLAMMFVADSEVCCIDEVSSGLDPLSRRKIWDILLNERGNRTILLTTHFLDEADYLADRILILSEGKLRAEGSSVELKQRWGSGYGVTFTETASSSQAMTGENHHHQHIIFNANTSDVIKCVDSLEERGITDYGINGPTIEDAFFNIVGQPAQSTTDDTLNGDVSLQEGKPIGMMRSTLVLLVKRLIILRRNFWPYILALMIPPVATISASIFLDHYNGGTCGSNQVLVNPSKFTPSNLSALNFVMGPAVKISSQVLAQLASILGISDISTLQESLHLVDTLDEFNQYISANYASVTPGGMFMSSDGSPATFAYRADGPIYLSMFTQNIFDSLLSNITTHIQYQAFSAYDLPSLGDSLQFIMYFGLAMAAYPAFFALYPTSERQQSIRALQYSNGARPLPLWLAYTLFDFSWVLIISVVSTILLAVFYAHWYQLSYLFVVFMLYGLCSVLLSYIISLFAKSQLSAFAFSAGGQAVMYLVYIIVYLSILTATYSESTNVNKNVNTAHFLLALLLPTGNLARALLVSLNTFSITCRGDDLASYPGDIYAYGGPILYLVLQAAAYFAFLIWWESGRRIKIFKKHVHISQDEEAELVDRDILEEIRRAENSNDSLRVLHASKVFGHNVAVSDVTFGSRDGDVFALLGPNGAGKTTLISLIRGELPMQDRRSEILVNGISIDRNPGMARSHLGFCPQVDAIDLLTVTEHLRLYGKIKGVKSVEDNVRVVLRLMGLEPYKNRLGSQLSGGWKRKLSLGIAIMGNPKVLLLDEPSSGMDAVAKRSMWKTIEGIKAGRSIVLTTHSMEEADALASRAGILAQRILALGTADHLRHKYSNVYTVHLTTRSAPHTANHEMEALRKWAQSTFDDAVLERRSLYGQLKFSIPASSSLARKQKSQAARPVSADDAITEVQESTPGPASRSGGSVSVEGAAASVVRDAFAVLEANRDLLNLEYYSVSPSALEEVFLEVVGRHNVSEEGHDGAGAASRMSQLRRRFQSWFLLNA